MNHRKIFSVFIIALCLIFLVSCGSEVSHEGETKVIFELEGAEYRSSRKPIVYYYKFPKDLNLIKDPTEIAEELSKTGITAEIKNPGFELDGWYKVKNFENGKVEYLDKWDFSKDLVDRKEGITLYAYWKQKLNNSFDIYALNEDGNEEFLINYPIEEGKALPNSISKVKYRKGYTFIEYLDSDKKQLETGFVHPGSADYLPVKIYARYIDGDYKVVRTKEELLKNIKMATNNIYLDADIDMGGSELYIKDYKGIFRGNNHKITNFYLVKEDTIVRDRIEEGNLVVSLFGKMTNAVVKDVTFEDVKLVFNSGISNINELHFNPLASKMTNSTFENVNFTGTYEVITWPDNENFNLKELSEYFKVLNDIACEDVDSTSKIVNVKVSFLSENK